MKSSTPNVMMDNPWDPNSRLRGGPRRSGQSTGLSVEAAAADLFFADLMGRHGAANAVAPPRLAPSSGATAPRPPRTTGVRRARPAPQPEWARVFDRVVHGAAPFRQPSDASPGLAAASGNDGWEPIALPGSDVRSVAFAPDDLVIERALGEGRLAFAHPLSELPAGRHIFRGDGRLRDDVLVVRRRSFLDTTSSGWTEAMDGTQPSSENASEDASENDAGLALDGEQTPTRPRLGQADARWAASADSPDHRHLLPDAGSATAFALTPQVLESLFRANRFLVPDGAGRVLFGLRACTLVGDALSSGWATSVSLQESSPDHAHARCVLGVWDRAGGRLVVFKGSTVPFWRAMENYRQGGDACNLLATGLYDYRIGTHRPGDALEIRGAFRQQGPVVVLRTRDNLVYEVSDLWESGDVGDNLHPARHPGLTPFSSEGCHTIPGEYDRATATHSGSWTDFRAAAGLSRASAPPDEDGRRFAFALLTGRDARLMAQFPAAVAASPRLRFGSRGLDVTALQMGLSAAGHRYRATNGVMDAATTLAYVRWQQSVDHGRADGIVTVDDARALGFDLATGRSIRPLAWRRDTTTPWNRRVPATAAASSSTSSYASPLTLPLAPPTASTPAANPFWSLPPAASAPTATPTTGAAALAPTVPPGTFTLTSSVGRGGINLAADVAALKARLAGLGYSWVRPGTTIDDETIHAIRLFQSIIVGSNDLVGDGLVSVPGRAGQAYEWLQATNAPRWQLMPAGSAAEGFDNVELADLRDRHDFGTDWLADVIRAAAAHYRDHHLRDNPSAALFTVNDVSLPRGGDTPDHAGHECGLACDLRLPRTDGTAPGGTTYHTDNYDRASTRAVIQSLRAQPTLSRVFFNDPVLIAEGMCAHADGHDNHVHFQITPPARRALTPVATPAGRQSESRGGEGEGEDALVFGEDAGAEGLPRAAAPQILDFRQTDLMANDPLAFRTSLREKAVELLGKLEDLGIGDTPKGRRNAYVDAIAWNESSTMRAGLRSCPRDQDGACIASSCGLVVRSLWRLLGARGVLSVPYRNGSAMEVLRQFARTCGAFQETRTRADFDRANVRPGDAIFINRGSSQHVFTVVERNAAEIISIDGGQSGASDGACCGIRRRRRTLTAGALTFEGDERPITGVVNLDRLRFTAPLIDLLRNTPAVVTAPLAEDNDGAAPVTYAALDPAARPHANAAGTSPCGCGGKS